MSSPAKQTQKGKPAPKERGTWLTILLVFIAAHAVFASAVIYSLRAQEYTQAAPWLWGLLALTALADIVAVIAMWLWKRWGIYLYAISTFVGIALGLIVTRSQLIVFHDIIPLGLLVYIISTQNKMKLFD